jgi:hypothetical protein
MAPVGEEVQQQTRRQQQKWHEPDEVCAVLGDQEIRGNDNKSEEYESRHSALATPVIGI